MLVGPFAVEGQTRKARRPTAVITRAILTLPFIRAT